MTKEKFFTSMGWVGMVTSILMYVFYIPQIANNLAGQKGTFIQPFMAGVNCNLMGCLRDCSKRSVTGLWRLLTHRVSSLVL